MRKLFFLLLLPLKLFCQNTIGLPDVINYTKQMYGGGLQNWHIKQDNNGIIYVANNEGLLIFNGETWNLFPLPNKTIVRSVEIGPDNKIYVGGQDELGYFEPGINGLLQYHSLTQFIPAKDRSFGDIWDIAYFNKKVFFRSNYKIYAFTGEAVEIYNAFSQWTYMGLSNGHLYAHDYKTGISSFENQSWVPLSFPNNLPTNDPVTSILPYQKDSSIITTLKNGLFVLSKTGISRLQSENNKLFQNERIYAATLINAERIALATNNNGIYIIDQKGNIIQSFAKADGLQNNNVLSIFPDREGNLWLGLDNGIDLITYSSAIKQINPGSQDGPGYTAAIYNNRLYIGTSNGLYSVLLQPVSDLSFSKGEFLPVENTKGQTWGLATINNQLLLGHHEGAFVIKNNTAEPISSNTGFWNFLPLSETFPSQQIIGGNYNGLNIFKFINGQFIQSDSIPGFNESSRFISLDRNDNIWVSHPYHGVYKIFKKNDGIFTTRIYTDKDGLPSRLNNSVFKIKNEVVVATEKGIFIYNETKDKFEHSPYYQNLLGDQSIRYLKEDIAGNIWFIHEKTLGVIDFSGKEPAIIYLPEFSNKILSGFEFIYPLDEKNIFLGGEKGFYHINFEQYKKTLPILQVQVRSVRILSKTDSLLFGGYFNEVNEQQIQDAKNIPEISYSWKTIRFEFSSSLYGYQSNLEYSYKLKGFDESWSEWTNRIEKEYTNLPAGNYVFEVKARNNFGSESEPNSYSFKILPPWYQTIWAKLVYLFLLGICIYILYKWQQKKFIQQQLKYEEEQRKLSYIHELELNKTESELIALRNEKLEAEINFKNSELASSAMHLVKKGELITSFKEELSQAIKSIDNPKTAAELKKISKALTEDENMDKEWESFSKHFDKVHSDFLVELKEKHPTITSNELKLSAYLRMNLSTKEIAQLMNISVRGVEISRYRLRKKLQIPSEKSLFDYLINIKTST